jgi:hypothetical protein
MGRVFSRPISGLFLCTVMFLQTRKLNLFIKIFCILTIFAISFFSFPAKIFAITEAEAIAGSKCDGEAAAKLQDCCTSKKGADWSCQDTSARADAGRGCVSWYCMAPGQWGSANIRCCPPSVATRTDGGGGGPVRGGLKEAVGGTGIPTGIKIEEKIGDIIAIILGFVGVIFLILMIFGGLMWMTAGGNEERLGKAKKLITSAVIGMIIVFSAYAITYFVTTTLLGTS